MNPDKEFRPLGPIETAQERANRIETEMQQSRLNEPFKQPKPLNFREGDKTLRKSRAGFR